MCHIVGVCAGWVPRQKGALWYETHLRYLLDLRLVHLDALPRWHAVQPLGLVALHPPWDLGPADEMTVAKLIKCFRHP